MSESLSWMQTGDTLALSGELDQDVLLPLWEMREEAVKGITCIDLSRVSRVDTGGLALLLHLAGSTARGHAGFAQGDHAFFAVGLLRPYQATRWSNS